MTHLTELSSDGSCVDLHKGTHTVKSYITNSKKKRDLIKQIIIMLHFVFENTSRTTETEK